MFEIMCIHCGKSKNVKRKDTAKVQKYCSISCNQKHVNKMRGKENHPSWKGGKRLNHNGYVEVRNPNHHRSRTNGYVFEHLLVAEEKYKREIRDFEQVHHIDGDKQNNDPKNLEILSHSEHSKLTAKIRKTKNMHNCIQCKNPTYKKPSEVEKNNNIFCSRKCLGKWTRDNKKGVFSK